MIKQIIGQAQPKIQICSNMYLSFRKMCVIINLRFYFIQLFYSGAYRLFRLFGYHTEQNCYRTNTKKGEWDVQKI